MNVVGRKGTGIVLLVGLLASGCAGSGQTLYLDTIPKTAPAQMIAPEGVKIVVEPFEDRRVDKTRVGMRSHLWGGVTYFDVTGQNVGEMYAQALADRLKTRGWQDRAWSVRVGQAGTAADADIVITGQILDFSANAKSRVFSTALATSSKLTVTAKNKSDQSTTNRTIEGAQTDTVFWYNDDDIKELLTATVKETINRYVEDTTVAQRAIRPSR